MKRHDLDDDRLFSSERKRERERKREECRPMVERGILLLLRMTHWPVALLTSLTLSASECAVDRSLGDGLLIAVAIQHGQMKSKEISTIPVQNEGGSVQLVTESLLSSDGDRQGANQRSIAVGQISVIEKVVRRSRARDRPVQREMSSGETSEVLNGGNRRFGGEGIGNDMDITENRTLAIDTGDPNEQREGLQRRHGENGVGISVETLVGPLMERDGSIAGEVQNVVLKAPKLPPEK